MTQDSSELDPEALSSMVEERIAEWRSRGDVPRRHRAEVRPLVTLSREVGAGGEALARRVAHELGFELWDRELVHEIATREGARDALIASLDEHAQGRIEEFVDYLALPEGTMGEYLRHLGMILGGLSETGNAVVVGRGAQFLVRAEHALRVRVVCPQPIRVKRLSERHGCDEAAAAARLRKRTTDQQRFYARNFGKDESDATHYDIVVNTGMLDLDTSAKVIVGAVRAKLGGRAVEDIRDTVHGTPHAPAW